MNFVGVTYLLGEGLLILEKYKKQRENYFQPRYALEGQSSSAVTGQCHGQSHIFQFVKAGTAEGSTAASELKDTLLSRVN